MDQISITKPKLILVEGNDDKLFFAKLTEAIGIADVQIHTLGGKDSFNVPNFRSVKITPDFRQVQYLIIVRDADEDAGVAFESICSILSSIQLPVPDRPLVFTAGILKVGVLIMPPRESSGKLEDVCLAMIKKNKEMGCIESFFSCLKKILSTDNFPRDLSKAKIQAFLSSQHESVPHLGIAASKGYFPLDSPELNEIKNFMEGMR